MIVMKKMDVLSFGGIAVVLNQNYIYFVAGRKIHQGKHRDYI